VLLLGRNVAGRDFREDTYLGHLELAYLIRARDKARVVNAIEQHLEASYARVLASYPGKGPELRLLRQQIAD
jgi:DNA-binding GntR family transcriptional regulator